MTFRFTPARPLLLFGALSLAGASPSAGQDFGPAVAEGTWLRLEGGERSQAHATAIELISEAANRLSGSRGLERAQSWAVAKLGSVGATRVHLEDCGPFGLGWRSRSASLAMVTPAATPFTVMAAPWSASSHGSRQAEAIAVKLTSLADFDRYRGKLRGKLIFLGDSSVPDLTLQPTLVRWSAEEIRSGIATRDIRAYYGRREARMAEIAANKRLMREIGEFLAEERIAALVLPSATSADAGKIETDTRGMPGGEPWKKEERLRFPVLRTSGADFARFVSAAAHGKPVRMRYNVDAQFEGENKRLRNIVAELPGTEPALAGQYVLVGAHLDSWAGGQGAVDNGAGVAIAIEAIRLLKTSGLALRRTVRIVLYSGEEQGLLCSTAYAEQHLGTIPRSEEADQRLIGSKPWRRPAGPFVPKPGYGDLSAAFNVDSGSGRFRAVLTGGNNPALAGQLGEWIGPLADLGMVAVLDEADWPADQVNYTELGLPGLSFVQDPLDYDAVHHSNRDIAERLNAADMAQASMILAALVARVAQHDALLPRTKPKDR